MYVCCSSRCLHRLVGRHMCRPRGGTCTSPGRATCGPSTGGHMCPPARPHMCGLGSATCGAASALSWRDRRGRRRGAADASTPGRCPAHRSRCPPAPPRGCAPRGLGVVLVVGPDQQVPPALVDRDALPAQPLGERARVVVGGEADVDLPLGFARLQRLLGLRLLQAGVLGRALGVSGGQRRRGVLPALLHRVPARQRDLPRQAVLLQRLAHDLARLFGGGERVGVEEHVVPLVRDRHTRRGSHRPAASFNASISSPGDVRLRLYAELVVHGRDLGKDEGPGSAACGRLRHPSRPTPRADGAGGLSRGPRGRPR